MLKMRESLLGTGKWVPLETVPPVLAKLDWLFWLVVVLPTGFAILYFGFLASDVYVSESQFVIRSPDKQEANALGVLLKSGGFSSADEEVYTAQDYVQSRDALRALNSDGAVARAYGNNNISIFDRFNPLGLSGTFEDLYRYYRGKVGVQFDSGSSIATLSVRAFAPGDAYKFNGELLGLAESLVNRLNVRGRNDMVQYASREVEDAQVAARNAASALASFRNSHGVVDPEEQAKVQLDMISKLQDELIGSRVQLAELRNMAPQNPQIPVLSTRINGLERQIQEQMGQVAGNRRSLSQTAVQYERLELDRELADKRVAAAMTSLQSAEDEAQRKQAYIERIAAPSRPDKAAEPRRLRGIFTTFLLGLVAWGIIRLLLAGLREHHG
jgi:BexC/CtrB/KpsE family polysaccharide export inner-membrane protein